MSKRNQIIAWVLTIAASAMPLMASVSKLMGVEQIVANFEKWGLSDNLMLIGIGELVSVVLFLVPKTRKYGMLLMSALMGGAIVTHMANGESFMMSVIVLVLIWVAGAFSHSGFYGMSKKD